MAAKTHAITPHTHIPACPPATSKAPPLGGSFLLRALPRVHAPPRGFLPLPLPPAARCCTPVGLNAPPSLPRFPALAYTALPALPFGLPVGPCRAHCFCAAFLYRCLPPPAWLPFHTRCYGTCALLQDATFTAPSSPLAHLAGSDTVRLRARRRRLFTTLPFSVVHYWLPRTAFPHLQPVYFPAFLFPFRAAFSGSCCAQSIFSLLKPRILYLHARLPALISAGSPCAGYSSGGFLPMPHSLLLPHHAPL